MCYTGYVMNISIIEKTKKYVVVKIPRKIWEKKGLEKESNRLTENEALVILKRGMAEFKSRKTKTLNSLRDFRYGD